MTGSKTRTWPIARTVRVDLRYQWASRYFLYTLVCFMAVASAFAVGAYATALSAVNSLRQEWAFLRQEGGYTFERAVGLGSDPTDDPLKETWESAGQAVANLHPLQGTVNLLQVLCFVIGPLVFFTYGAIAPTRDAHYKTLKFRAVREGPRRLFLSQVVALTAAVTALTAAAFVATLLTSTALHLAVSGRVDTRLLEVPGDLSPADTLPTLAMTLATGGVFALLGMSAALIVRRPLYVLPVFLVGFFLVPILGRFDPRNLLMAIAYPHLEFVGGFIPPAPARVSELVAAALLAVGTAGVLAVTYAVHSRRSLYTT
ncbi:hypothetical protein [Streptomyces sp. HSG2]|uniref:hypothetical protein n=1 Tax=Streptomyces sp. HSG2 TaxID=2797167 RepID=UPI001907DF7A|nr:hypothetical protein [Streptomyces sp. HSG2]